jgi:hypothetical protein
VEGVKSMKLSRKQLRQLITEVLNEAPQQSAFDLRREIRDKFVNDHLMRYYKSLYSDKSINGPDDIRIARFSNDERNRGYSTTSSWGDYEWNDKALRYGKGIGRDDFPVIWFSRPDTPSNNFGNMFGDNALDAILHTMNKPGGPMDGSGYELARTSTSSNDPFSVYHGAADKSVTVVYMKKI